MTAFSERIYAAVKEEWTRQRKAYQLKHSQPTKSDPRFAFKVLAAIVVQDTDADSLQVLTFGTGTQRNFGTQSLGDGTHAQSQDGSVILNSHSEVMARRAFKRLLISEIKAHQAQDRSKTTSRFLDSFYKGPHSIGYRLRRHLKVHLFISAPPCGLAPVVKPLNVPVGQLTTCSDKLTLWCVVGLQGAHLSRLGLEPIYLESVTVQSEATGAGLEGERVRLAQVLTGRLESGPEGGIPLGRGSFTLHSPQSDCISQDGLWFYGAPDDGDFTGKNSNASTLSHNWIQWQDWEFVDAQTGLVHVPNYLRAKKGEQLSSRLSKKEFLTEIRALGDFRKSYYKLKQEAVDYQLAKKSVREAWPSLGLGIWVQRNGPFEDFI